MGQQDESLEFTADVVRSMSSPEIVNNKEGGNNFSVTATNAAHRLARPRLDNVYDPVIQQTLFDPTVDKERLDEVNLKLKTTIIIKPGLMD